MKAKRMTSKMRIEKWKQKSRSIVTSDRFGAPLSIQLFQFKTFRSTLHFRSLENKHTLFLQFLDSST